MTGIQSELTLKVSADGRILLAALVFSLALGFVTSRGLMAVVLRCNICLGTACTPETYPHQRL